MGGNIHQFFTSEPSIRLEQKTREWDLNEWKWDGEAFIAVPVIPGPLERRNKQPLHDAMISNSSSTGSDECHFRIIGKGFGEVDKRRRILAVGDDKQCDEVGSLSLNLGHHAYPVMEESLAFGGVNNGKNGTAPDTNINRPKCQVDGCNADLSQSKDYHRRHKVCELHSKAISAVIGSVVQRFCQQCSRFHLLQEFDEGKRSCRRRLAGHNRRRRKNYPDVSPSGCSALDNQSASHLLISLLRILANITCDKSQQSKDSELLWNLLRSAASLASLSDTNNSARLLQPSQDLHTVGTSARTSEEDATALLSHAVPMQENFKSCSPAEPICTSSMAANHCVSISAIVTEKLCQQNVITASFSETQANCSKRTIQEENGVPVNLGDLCSWKKMRPCMVEGTRTKGLDLNAAYIEHNDGKLGCEQPEKQTAFVFDSSTCPPWMARAFHQPGTTQLSGNANSTTTRYPERSNGDAQSRTDRIVFKLFGKDPNDFPLGLRSQIFDWLSHTPTDMESYIRPGCIILTIYLHLGVSAWDELCHDLGSSLIRLLSLSNDNFWKKGWIYARLRNHIALIFNGQVVLPKSLIMERSSFSKIFIVTPIAAPPSSKVTFVVKGSNLVRSTTRLLCAFEGRYLSHETGHPSDECANYEKQPEQFQFLSLSCYLSDAIGRGFIEVEDNGLSSGFFPFIVAEEDVCAEIRMLESSLETASCDDEFEGNLGDARNQSMNFIHEMGWLLRKSRLKSKSGSNNHCFEPFSITRFKWVLRFSVDHDWSAIVKKLLDILFDGIVDLGGISAATIALSENLLHYAVQRNSKLTAKLLLKYKPCKSSDMGNYNIFRPDMLGPSNITPLHIAASSTHENMLDLLTDDPGQFGIKAWSSARDSSGFTPEDYALARGNESYILLLQKKSNKSTKKSDVAVSIPANLSLASDDTKYKNSETLKSSKLVGLGISKGKSKPSQPPFCKLCEQRLLCSNSMQRSLLYRPMLLSMVGIAAVCVCVALILKGPPDVLFVYPPFRWESLESGFM